MLMKLPLIFKFKGQNKKFQNCISSFIHIQICIIVNEFVNKKELHVKIFLVTI